MYRGGLGINRDNASDIADSYVFANVLHRYRKDCSSIHFLFCTINVIAIYVLCYNKIKLISN